VSVFVHDDPEFDQLLGVTARARGVSVAMVEKDYWVTHSLWALQNQGFEVWFKGGTSLSKGFGLIERFSEDLDLKVEPGTTGLAPVTNWKSDKPAATQARRDYFVAISAELRVPGATLRLVDSDTKWRAANLRVFYPGQHLASLSPLLSPFVLLELGEARVTPFVLRPLRAFVHDTLEERGLVREYTDNRPDVRCVHPLVTLLEKLDALQRRVARLEVPAPKFVRHFEDAARIVRNVDQLPALSGYSGVVELAGDMVAGKQLQSPPSSNHACLVPDDGERWAEIRAAHRAISPMFWGPRISIDEACAELRAWLASRIA
jgi:hypothetical protein